MLTIPLNKGKSIVAGVIFNEKNIAMRATGTLLMFAGAVLITMKGK
jgi:hypothetical protein